MQMGKDLRNGTLLLKSPNLTAYLLIALVSIKWYMNLNPKVLENETK